MNSKLEKLGLSKNESAVYLALLRAGASSAGDVTKKSGVHRRNVYDALGRLEKRGLVCQVIRENARCFKAANPANLMHLVEDEKKRISLKEGVATDIARELMPAFENSREDKVNVTVSRGIKGIRAVFQDILDTGKENRVLGAHTPPEVILSYLENFHQRRVRLGIRDMLIFSNDFDRAREVAKLPHTEVRIMPRKQDKTTCMNIYGDKVAMLSWSEPVSVVIDDGKIAGFFRHYFDFLWKSLK